MYVSKYLHLKYFKTLLSDHGECIFAKAGYYNLPNQYTIAGFEMGKDLNLTAGLTFVHKMQG